MTLPKHGAPIDAKGKEVRTVDGILFDSQRETLIDLLQAEENRSSIHKVIAIVLENFQEMRDT